ncbi:MAG: GH32 C-terminal domain-containing protein, partial [Planctomycetota bacterium]
PDGVRLFRRPVKEIENIRTKAHSWSDAALKPGENLLSGLSGELFDIRAEIAPGGASEVGFVLRGERAAYNVAAGEITCLGKTAPLALADGRISLQILLDRTSIEVFGNDGQISMPSCFLPDPADTGLEVYAAGGEARIVSLDVYELRSIWPEPGTAE